MMDLTPFIRDCRKTAESLGARITDGSNVVRIHDRMRVRSQHAERFFDYLQDAAIEAKARNDEALMRLIDRQMKAFGDYVEETMG